MQITHPYHPLHGQHFSILKSRRVRGVECLILQGSDSGTFSVPRDWTDRAFGDVYSDAGIAPRFFTVETLLQVAAIVNSQEEKVD